MALSNLMMDYISAKQAAATRFVNGVHRLAAVTNRQRPEPPHDEFHSVAIMNMRHEFRQHDEGEMGVKGGIVSRSCTQLGYRLAGRGNAQIPRMRRHLSPAAFPARHI